MSEFIKELESRYKEAKSQYQSLKQYCENQVVRCEYATGPFYEANPIYHQMHEIPKGKLVRGDISEKYFLYEYGFDSNEKLVLSRQIVHSLLPKLQFYEEFFINGNDVTLGYLFDYSDEKNVINVTSAIYADGRIREYKGYARGGWSRETFMYENDLVKQVEQTYYSPDYSKNIENRFYNVFYDEKDKVKTVQMYVPAKDSSTEDYSRIVYQKPEKDQKIKILASNIEDKLVQAIPLSVFGMGIKEKVYSIILSYSLEATEFFPPTITVGLETEREYFIETEGKRAKEFVWNSAELKNRTEIPNELLGECTINECQVFNNYIVQNEKWLLIDKTLNTVVERLLKYNWQDIIPIASDFVIFVEDDSDTKCLKSIKKLNKEECLAELKKKKLI